MPKPRILIPVPTSFDHDYNARSIGNYADAVRQAGGDPVELPLSLPPSEVLAIAHTAQGILLPGSGADVDPTRYGQPRQPESADPDPLRESIDTLLIEHAERTRTPLLCICFGTQSLNVHRGGTLIQHLTPMPVNHRAGHAVAVAHAIDIAPGSHLATLVPPAEATTRTKPSNETHKENGDEVTDRNSLLHLNVNSSHHQAIGIPGEGLRIVARSTEDGVIEAVENDPAYHPPTQSNTPTDEATTAAPNNHWLLALQWHPERTTDISPTSRAIFTDFIQAAFAHQTGSTTK